MEVRNGRGHRQAGPAGLNHGCGPASQSSPAFRGRLSQAASCDVDLHRWGEGAANRPAVLSPDAELFALDEDHANALDPVTISIDGELGDARGSITLRYAWLPPSFGATDKDRDAIGINANSRFPILKHYHGIIFSRNGTYRRHSGRTPWTTFINNDRYIRVEIEFSASVTTAKQQVSLSREVAETKSIAALDNPDRAEELRATLDGPKERASWLEVGTSNAGSK